LEWAESIVAKSLFITAKGRAKRRRRKGRVGEEEKERGARKMDGEG